MHGRTHANDDGQAQSEDGNPPIFTPANWSRRACRATPESRRAAKTCPPGCELRAQISANARRRGIVRTPDYGRGTDVNASRRQALQGRPHRKCAAAPSCSIPRKHGYSPAFTGAHDDKRKACASRPNPLRHQVSSRDLVGLVHILLEASVRLVVVNDVRFDRIVEVVAVFGFEQALVGIEVVPLR